MSARVAVVIVNYRTPDLALGAVAALQGERAALPGLRVVLVDGGSGDGSAERLAQGLADTTLAGWATLLPLPINGGFGWANNQAMQRLLQGDDPPDFIHLLNPDTIAEPGAVTRLAAVLDAHSQCGAVGSLLLETDGAPSGSAFTFPSACAELVRGSRVSALRRLLHVPPVAYAAGVAGQVDWVTGASVMLRATALREAGLFDTGFFLYFEELELMSRLTRVGWTIRHEPASRVRHVGGAATGVNRSRIVEERPTPPPYWFASRRRMFALTGGRLHATIASLAWLAGHAFFHTRRLAGRARAHIPTRDEGRGLLRHGVLPTQRDLTPAVTRWHDPMNLPPAWMSRTSGVDRQA